MKERILSEVNKKHNSSGGKCGLTPIELCRILEVSYAEIKEYLNDMHFNKELRVRKGINSFLLFKE